MTSDPTPVTVSATRGSLDLAGGALSGKAGGDMTSKGPSSVDPDLTVAALDAPPTVSPSPTRRRLMVGALAALGTSAAVVGAARPVSAAPEERPNLPTEDDVALLMQAMRLELTARDLYRAALSSVSSDLATVIGVLGDNHGAYAEAIAGDTGLSANQIGRDDELFDSLEGDFTSAGSFPLAAHTLEQTAVATHKELLERYESSDAVELTGSIMLAEARHATVLADVAGVSDLAVVFATTEAPLSIDGGA